MRVDYPQVAHVRFGRLTGDEKEVNSLKDLLTEKGVLTPTVERAISFDPASGLRVSFRLAQNDSPEARYELLKTLAGVTEVFDKKKFGKHLAYTHDGKQYPLQWDSYRA